MVESIQLVVPRRNRLPFARIPTPEMMDEARDRGLPDVEWGVATSWLWNTHVQLREAGVETILVDHVPERGIVVICGYMVPLTFRSSRDQFLVAVAADSPPRIFADMHVLQNPVQASKMRSSFADPVSVYIPHWPQPGLRPRDSARDERFKRVAFLGAKGQMASFLEQPGFADQLSQLGLELVFRHGRFEQHDYSTIDAVVAVRSFDGNRYPHKPASKLVNAWLAGVPAILGAESAYQALRRSPYDYLEVTAPEQVIDVLKQLKEDIGLRRRVVEQGIRRAKEFSDKRLVSQWVTLLTETIPAARDRVSTRGRGYRMAIQADQLFRRAGQSALRRLDRLRGREDIIR